MPLTPRLRPAPSPQQRWTQRGPTPSLQRCLPLTDPTGRVEPPATTQNLPLLFPGLTGDGVRQLAGLYRAGSSWRPSSSSIRGAGGHHIFSKAAFPESIHNRMFSISRFLITQLGWDHQAMSNEQRKQYMQILASRALAHVLPNQPHTMCDEMRVAYWTLRAGNATHGQARWLVMHALRNLRQLGIRGPIRIPYGP